MFFQYTYVQNVVGIFTEKKFQMAILKFLLWKCTTFYVFLIRLHNNTPLRERMLTRCLLLVRTGHPKSNFRVGRPKSELKKFFLLFIGIFSLLLVRLPIKKSTKKALFIWSLKPILHGNSKTRNPSFEPLIHY